MKNQKIILLAILFLFSARSIAQNTQTGIGAEYPYKIGNIGFAVDSLEYPIGNVLKGEIINKRIGMYNFGKDVVTFRAGKASRFLDVNYEPAVLQPGQAGTVIVNFEVIKDLPLGNIEAEIAIESDDKQNPYKFLYLVGNITEDSSRFQKKMALDTVPRLIFEQYNFDFGHLTRGKKVIHTFFFTNMGSQDLFIDEVIPSEGCYILKAPENFIPPGGYGSMVVKVNTVGEFGVQHKTVNITSNDPIHPLITLGIHGTVRQQSPANQNPSFCYE